MQSRLVDRAARGKAFVIAKAGKPLVKVSPVDAPAEPQRLGFLKGEIEVPGDFDRMGERARYRGPVRKVLMESSMTQALSLPAAR